MFSASNHQAKGHFKVDLKFKPDLHCHTEFSFDSETPVNDLCESAINKGITHLAITDHCDLDCILEGVYDPYLSEKAKDAIIEAKELYKDKLDIIYGIELGGAHAVPPEAEKLVKEQGFDFVLGSLHNLKGVPDFFFMDYSEMPDGLIRSLVSRNISELKEIARLPFINSVAHVTYPLRYIRMANRLPEFDQFNDPMAELFEIIIKTGKALEVNTSPYRKGIADTMPERYFLERYKAMGGSKITLGSDAHTADGVGDGIVETMNTLSEIGFDSSTVYGSNGENQFPISF